MNYAQQLRNTYFENKDTVNEHRKSLMLCGVLTLEHKLKDSYEAYKQFCYQCGVQPKKIIDFLKTEII